MISLCRVVSGRSLDAPSEGFPADFL
jgi:hypothetical protein